MNNISKLIDLITKDDKQLANELWVSTKTISRWRTGESIPIPQTRYRIYIYIQKIINELTRAKNVWK